MKSWRRLLPQRISVYDSRKSMVEESVVRQGRFKQSLRTILTQAGITGDEFLGAYYEG